MVADLHLEVIQKSGAGIMNLKPSHLTLERILVLQMKIIGKSIQLAEIISIGLMVSLNS